MVVINKIDRPGARPDEVIDEVLDLFIELGADENQIEFPVIFASAREGFASFDKTATSGDMRPLLEAIIDNIPAPECDAEAPLQLLFSALDYDDYVGRIGVGRIERGSVKAGQAVVLCQTDGGRRNVKVSRLYLLPPMILPVP